MDDFVIFMVPATSALVNRCQSQVLFNRLRTNNDTDPGDAVLGIA